MAEYKIKISATAEKSLRKIPKKDLSKIIDSVKSLSINPYPDGCRKLEGEENIYRIRQGTYRIIYEIHKNILSILVLKIGHRKDIYR